MFWNWINTKKVEKLEEDMKKLQKEFDSLKLDVEVYHMKLKNVKGVKPVRDEEADAEKKDLYGGMFLPENGQPNSPSRFAPRR